MVNGPDDVYVERKGRIEWMGDAAEGGSLAPQRGKPPRKFGESGQGRPSHTVGVDQQSGSMSCVRL